MSSFDEFRLTRLNFLSASDKTSEKTIKVRMTQIRLNPKQIIG